MERRDFLRISLLSAVAVKFSACHEAECNVPQENCAVLYPFYIDETMCTACGRCVPQCGKKAFTLPGSPNRVHIDPLLCTRCGACFMACENQGYFAVQRTLAADNQYVYEIDQDACQRCLACYRSCPVTPNKAIIQSNLNRTRIDQTRCSHCGECVELTFCPFGAIYENHPH